MTTTAITVALADFDVALGATIPFAPTDEGPVWYGIQLRAVDGWLTAAATDGSVAARVRKPATGRLYTTFLLHRSHAELVRSALAFHLDTASRMPVTLSVTGDFPHRLLTIGVDGRFTTCFYEASLHPADIDALLNPPGTAGEQTPAEAPTPMPAQLIEPFLHVAALAKKEPLRWTLHGPSRTNYVRVGDWFTGVLMPEATAVTGR